MHEPQSPGRRQGIRCCRWLLLLPACWSPSPVGLARFGEAHTAAPPHEKDSEGGDGWMGAKPTDTALNCRATQPANGTATRRHSGGAADQVGTHTAHACNGGT